MLYHITSMDSMVFSRISVSESVVRSESFWISFSSSSISFPILALSSSAFF